MSYPEHEKMKRIKPEADVVARFLEWLDERGYIICQRGPGSGRHGEELWPMNKQIEWFLAEHFEIDLKKIQDEKDAMLDNIREANRANRG